jgi:DNA replication and repair protein RecF
MQLRSLYLQKFRNYAEAFFEFDPSFNLICGPNAQGKTSVLEAIHYLMMGRSFRSTHHIELIQHQMPSFYLEATFSKHQVEQKLVILFDGKDRKIMYNSSPISTISSLLGLIQGVILTPDDVQLIKGPPLLRRQFLDIQIAQVDPLYVHHLTRYHRAMRQRNQLLKTSQQLSIEIWEQEMSQSAAYIIQQRQQTIKNLQVYAQQLYLSLTGKKHNLEIHYKTHYKGEWKIDLMATQFMEQLKRHRVREMALGYTLTGPHKDDLIFTIDEKDVRHFASEGEQRSCVTALHFSEWQQMKDKSNILPLMMMDDVGMGLDHYRRSSLLDQLGDLGQIFLTTTDESILNHHNKSKKLFRIKEGNLL